MLVFKELYDRIDARLFPAFMAAAQKLRKLTLNLDQSMQAGQGSLPTHSALLNRTRLRFN